MGKWPVFGIFVLIMQISLTSNAQTLKFNGAKDCGKVKNDVQFDEEMFGDAAQIRNFSFNVICKSSGSSIMKRSPLISLHKRGDSYEIWSSLIDSPLVIKGKTAVGDGAKIPAPTRIGQNGQFELGVYIGSGDAGGFGISSSCDGEEMTTCTEINATAE
jgi:hypothetical protein